MKKPDINFLSLSTVQAGGTVRAEPLIDKAGRTYDQLVALGKKLLPRLNKNGWFMPKSPGRPPGIKSKPNMETPAATPPPSPAPAAGPAPNFNDVDAALRSAPKDDTPEARAESLSAEISGMDENTTAATIIGIIQTGLILIGEEEGVLSPIEIELVRKPLVRVLKKYNIGDNIMPAEIDLALALLGLIVARLKKPKTATAFAKFKAWAIQQWAALAGRRLASQVREHAPSQ